MYYRIKELRIDHDLTQKQLSCFLNLDQSNYSKIELGKQYLRDDILIKLSDFYSVSTDYLLGLTDVTTRYPRSSKQP